MELDPLLVENEGQCLAEVFSSWIDLPKTACLLDYLETVYDNLPDSLHMLQQRKRQHVGLAAIQLAFYSYQQDDLAMTRYAVQRAFRCQPRYLLNRGALVIFLRSARA